MPELFRTMKSVQGVSGLELDTSELVLINQHTLREYAAEDLFAFKVTACDNEIDRDKEAFATKTLEQLAELYVGKTMLDANHAAFAENQCARVYAAEVVREQSQLTSYGEPYARLVVRAYIPRTEVFAELIQLIEAGIRKEVSVGCAIAHKTCSICSKPYWSAECEHQQGMEYENGRKCFVILEEARDAYEISFVAIPAQPAAGVTKSASQENSNPFLAELHGIMATMKSIAAEMRGPSSGELDDPLPQPNPLDADAEELIRSANALYNQYTNEKE